MGEDRKIRLLLVDDHPIIRDGIRARFASQTHIEIVGEASDGQDAVQKAQELSPDIVFMDIGLPGMNGLEATRSLRRIVPQTGVIILTVYDDREYVVEALRCGARGYILKNSSSVELIRAVETVRRGDLYIPANASQKVFEEYAREAESQGQPELSRREQEVLTLIAEGHTNKGIADLLSVSVRTVETHREHIMRKLDIHTVAGLTRYAIAKELIPLK